MNESTSRIWSRPLLLSSNGEGVFYYYSKRLLDVVITVSGLVLVGPLMLLIAIAIKWDSPGPVLFVQERVGSRRRPKDGKVVWEVRNFRFYKFRSMFRDSDQSLHRKYIEAFVKGDLEPGSDSEARFKLSDDPRVTKVGRMLRKSSLDELPQLINILKGEMSLVGPRPVPTYEVAAYEEKHYERLTALPGITGLWQVKGRGRVTFEDMIDLDIEYVRRRSLLLDIKLLLQTVPIVLSGKGAR